MGALAKVVLYVIIRVFNPAKSNAWSLTLLDCKHSIVFLFALKTSENKPSLFSEVSNREGFRYLAKSIFFA